MPEDLRTPDRLEARLTEDEERLAADEQRLAADEQRLSRDEARIEAEEVEVKENRIVAWFGVGLALVLVVAVTALVLGLIAVQDDVGSIRRAAGDGSVATAALQDGAVTMEKLAVGAVTRDAVAGEAIGTAELAPRSVTGAQVARDTLTGADIREPSLGPVPVARKARVADDAARLGGLPARVYLSRLSDVRATTVTDARRVKGPLTARCPAGTRVISGGAAVRGVATGAALTRSEPEDGTGWTATARVASARRAWRLVVTAICAAGGS
jgi:hypothetical protein